MRRIMILGVSAGVGKSTFAQRLGRILNIEVFHLDKLYWKRNWVESTVEEFAAHQQKIVEKEKWIIEGNYSNTYDIRAKYADTIIYLELPLIVCISRVFKRLLLNIGKTRPDMAPGCKEKIDYEFLKFICTTYHSRKKKMNDRLEQFHQSGIQKNIIILKSKKDIQTYIDNLSTLKRSEQSIK
ncbi:P-loop NTPase family protein [Alkalihalobacterium elongatum]|uniref:topology modulation protein n=1 Tax=Alkalihalobacterium elongatum TaxID=2675466 RepID=UPI001C1FEA73|nr:topology modulation protein [Alkalihalobacterium elongatum]